MQSYYTRIRILAVAALFCTVSTLSAHAAGGIETAGDVLTAVLPAAAGGLMLGHKDVEGAWQFAESTALALGVTYLLKFTVSEERPNNEDCNHSRRRTLRSPSPRRSSFASVTDGSTASLPMPWRRL